MRFKGYLLPAFLFFGCASTSARPSTQPVKFYTAFRTGSEALPTTAVGGSRRGIASPPARCASYIGLP